MKLGEGGEAFFVFQTEGDIPEEMRTSPLVSPAQSPVMHPDNVLTAVCTVCMLVLMVAIRSEFTGTGLFGFE